MLTKWRLIDDKLRYKSHNSEPIPGANDKVIDGDRKEDSVNNIHVPGPDDSNSLQLHNGLYYESDSSDTVILDDDGYEPLLNSKNCNKGATNRPGYESEKFN